MKLINEIEDVLEAKIKVITRQGSGTKSSFISSFDKEFKDMKLKKNIKVMKSDFGHGFEGIIMKGSLVSNLAGGVFIKFANRDDEPKDIANKTWGVPIISSKENLEVIASVL